jgi:hypothetical protein
MPAFAGRRLMMFWLSEMTAKLLRNCLTRSGAARTVSNSISYRLGSFPADF